MSKPTTFVGFTTRCNSCRHVEHRLGDPPLVVRCPSCKSPHCKMERFGASPGRRHDGAVVVAFIGVFFALGVVFAACGGRILG